MTNNSSRRRSLGWVIAVPCTSRNALRTDSQKGIGEILNTKLSTIIEEPENLYEGNNNVNSPRNINTKISRNISSMKLWLKEKKGKDRVLSTNLFKRSKLHVVSRNLCCVKASYINFLSGFVTKGSFTGLPLCY